MRQNLAVQSLNNLPIDKQERDLGRDLGSGMTIDLLQPIASLEAEERKGNAVIARLCTSTNNFSYALGSIWLRRQPSQRLE